MAKKYAELRAKMTPRAKELSEKLYRSHRAEMALAQLREVLALTQEELAQSLDVSQEAVSRMERRPDILVSTLRRVVEAMGGQLEIRAIVPSGTVTLEGLGEAAAGKAR